MPKKIDENLEMLKKDLEEAKNAAKRAQADFINYKNRTEKEKAEWIKFGEATLLAELLPVIDNFDKAWDHIPKDMRDNSWFKGVEGIKRQFESVLKCRGLEKIECLSKDFNPEFHEAVCFIESDEEIDRVCEVYEEGYRFKEKILRPAKVRVSKSINNNKENN
jgi:molecular chaperone GrpE